MNTHAQSIVTPARQYSIMNRKRHTRARRIGFIGATVAVAVAIATALVASAFLIL